MCAHKEARKKAKKAEREKAKKAGKRTVRVARLRIPLSTIDENNCSQFADLSVRVVFKVGYCLIWIEKKTVYEFEKYNRCLK